jgi:glycosyltransferase 2 family protein
VLKTPVKLLVVGLCGFLLYRNLRGADLGHLGHILRSVGWWGLLLPVPFILSQTVDTFAWRNILRRLGQNVTIVRLFPVRMAVEAMGSSLPAGVVVAESVCPQLLEDQCGIPKSTTLASAAARRWLTMRAHSVYVTLGAVAAWITLRHAGDAGWQRFGPLVVLGSAILPLGASFALSVTLGSGSRISGLWKLLARIPWKALQRWLERKREGFAATDRGFATLAEKGASFWAPTAMLLFSWLCESVESFLFMHFVGTDLSFLQVMSFEAGLSVLRSAWFFAPAGLGAEDLGYLGALHLLGVPDPSTVGAAFLVLKRGRELCWVILGYTWMALRMHLGPLGAMRRKAVTS